jgi:small-conductance mechanosensitive channel
MVVNWVWGGVVVAVIWGALSWNYVEVGDQVSRRWSARDWSAGISAIVLEVALGLVGIVLIVGLFGGWALRLVCWNLAAPAFVLSWLLRDIRRTAREHYARGAARGPAEAAPVAEDEEEV